MILLWRNGAGGHQGDNEPAVCSGSNEGQQLQEPAGQEGMTSLCSMFVGLDLNACIQYWLPKEYMGINGTGTSWSTDAVPFSGHWSSHPLYIRLYNLLFRSPKDFRMLLATYSSTLVSLSLENIIHLLWAYPGLITLSKRTFYQLGTICSYKMSSSTLLIYLLSLMC